MRKLFFVNLTFLLIISNMSLYAQMQVGPKVGLNISNIRGDVDELLGENFRSKIGYNIGLFFLYRINNLLSIQPEAYYSVKGVETFYAGYDRIYSFDYIEFPLLVKFSIPAESLVLRPSFLAGPSIGFNVAAKFSTIGENDGMEVKDLKSTEFSLILGAGIGFILGNNELGFDLRYILGLSNFKSTEGNEGIKNKVISFNIYFGKLQ